MNITVIGAARSGIAVAQLLARHGHTVFLSEFKPDTQNLAETLTSSGIASEFGGHSEKVLSSDAIVLSPGVPAKVPIIVEAKTKGIPIYSEVEAASWYCKAPILAITGSNGKTTTTTWIQHTFETAKAKHHVGGNIGTAFSLFADETTPDETVILEISSFQLDDIEKFSPKISLLLNITPDHLDRYEYKFENYANSKFRIFEHQQSDDIFIYNADDEVIQERIKKGDIQAKLVGFSLMSPSPFDKAENNHSKGDLGDSAFIEDDHIVLRKDNKTRILMPISAVSLPGKHNLYNALATALACSFSGISDQAIIESLSTFKGVAHRLEFVRALDGVTFYNDSKATNVDAVWYALQSFTQPIVLLAGGIDKGNDYSVLKELVEKNVRVVIGVGESSGEKVVNDLGKYAPKSHFVKTMEEAVVLAQREAQNGEIVLLSPACASFDLFNNYEHRGEVFKDLVHQLHPIH